MLFKAGVRCAACLAHDTGAQALALQRAAAAACAALPEQLPGGAQAREVVHSVLAAAQSAASTGVEGG